MEAFNTSITPPIPYTYSIITTKASDPHHLLHLPMNSNNTTNTNRNTSSMTINTSSCYNNNGGSSSCSPWMDSRIWSRLPQRLLYRILVFLPPPAFFRARSVCKRWYALLYSSTFLQLYLHISPRRHCFLFFNLKVAQKPPIYRNSNNNNNDNISPAGDTNTRAGYGGSYCEAYLFDPNEIAWHRITLPMIPPGFTPCSTSNGLICWVSDEAGPKTLFLHNPLVGILIQLPPTLRPRLFPSIGLGITNTSIDITVAGDDMISPYAVKNLTTESFHIDAGGFYSIWGTSSALPRLCSLESGHMTYHDNRFYCMNYSPFSVLTYDVASNSWWKVQAPMRRFLRSPSLVEIDGKLMLVAAVEKSKLNVPKSLRVWCLQGSGTTWVEVERMPQQLYQQFAEVECGGGFDCIGQGEFVVILIRGVGVGVSKGVVFDMRRKRWMWMPPCPFVNSAGGEMQGFGFEPRLATPVTGLLDQLALPFQSSFNLA